MTSRRPGRWLLGASATIYRVLLYRYPRALRRRYGMDMRAIFEAEARRGLEVGGLRGLAAVWWKTLLDLARPTPRALGPRSSSRPVGSDPPTGAPGSGLTGIREDLAFALRSLVREPGFTWLVVCVLAVGIALNTSAFSVLNAYLLRPLPFPDADRLVNVRNGEAVSWTEVGRVFERAISWDLDVFTIVGDGRPEMAPGAWVTPDFLDAYGVEARLGRTFLPDEAGRSGAPVVMISHRLWRERFGGDPAIVGRTFSAFTSDRPDHAEVFTIVGVLPADFWYLNEYTEVLAPIRDERAVYAGRLRPDVPLERAEAVLTEMAERRMEQVPPGFRVTLEPLQERHTARVRPTLLVLQAAVLLVLLVACANAAVLLLVRSGRREREMGVRRALGAPGMRLARQLFLEGLLLSGAATGLGLLVTWWLLGVGRSSVEARLGLSVPGGPDALSIDVTVLAGAAGVAALVGLLFGAVPLATALRGAPAMGGTRRGGTESRGRRRFRGAMVAAEVALSLALLIGAGLMVRSAVHLQGEELGFDPTHVVRGQMGLREASYPEAADRVAAFSMLRESLGAARGVERVGLASLGLFSTRFGARPVEGLAPEGTRRSRAVRWIVDEEYPAVLGIRLVRGRPFSSDDGAGAEGVALVSESLARELWPGSDPVGRLVRTASQGMPGMTPDEPGAWLRVVGVVSDVRRAVDDPDAGDLYVTYRQSGPSWLNAVVRFRDEPDDLGVLQDAVDAVSSEIPLATVRRLDRVVDEAMRPTRVLAGLLVGFSSFALLLAVLGLYGVVSYAARRHRKEVAIRMALGAGRRSVTAELVRQGLVMVVAGLAVGTVGGFLLGEALASQLHGVSPRDPSTYLVLAGALAASALVAMWIPARRAASGDPMGVLREE